MKREINLTIVIKFAIAILMVGSLTLSLKNVFDCLTRSQTVHPEMVESFRPSLNVNLIKKAAALLGYAQP